MMTLNPGEGVGYSPMVAANPLGSLCYMGIEEMTPLGLMTDQSFNLRFFTVDGILPLAINISCWDPWFLHSIYFSGPSPTILLKVYNGEGDEIFTDFFLSAQTATDPFPLLIPYPFQPNDLLRFDVLDVAPAKNFCEVIFRGYTLNMGASASE